MEKSDTPEPSGLAQKAYSYLRFSTPEQSKGDSFNRQTRMALDYARKHGLELDETLTFHDKGVSGFRGQNVNVGRLADFREAVKVGLVPQGSVLLVEQLDRLSRLSPRKALRVLEDIVEAGVSVVTLNDGREYTPESLDHDHMDLLISLLTFMRANEESETKSRRLRQAWEAKLSNIREKPRTSIAPAWVHLNKQTGRFEPIAERTALIQRIFAMTLEGRGQHKIAETFNREGIPPWGRAKHWQRSYIAKILSNPSVVGVVVPHRIEHHDGKKRRIALDPVADYYPPAISRATFERAQALQSAKVGPDQRRPARKSISNILAGLATCPACASTMTRVNKGSSAKNGYVALVCTRAKAGAGCEYHSVQYDVVEASLLHFLPALISQREGLQNAEGCEAKIEQLEEQLSRHRADIEFLTDQLLQEHSPALATRLRRLEGGYPALQGALRRQQDLRDATAGPVVNSRIERALECLQADDDNELDREAANAALRAIFKRAVINWPKGRIDLHWIAGGTCEVFYWEEPGRSGLV